MINISNEQLAKLKEKSMTDKEISKYCIEKLGIEISEPSISRRLIEYYESIGKKKPAIKQKKYKKVKISGHDVAKLKNQNMSFDKISKYYKELGIEVSSETLREVLYAYYEAMGMEKPKYKNGKGNKIDISDKELARLKEQGMTEVEISKHCIEKLKIEISASGVNRRLTNYYELIGREKPKNEIRTAKKDDISIEELVEKKEQEMTDKQISQSYGGKISRRTVSLRLSEHYKLIGKKKPRIKNKRGKKIDIEVEELLKLKRDYGMSNEKISEYCAEKLGIEISEATVGIKINRYNLSLANKMLKEIFMKGCSIKAYCDKHEGNETLIKERLERIRYIAEHAVKMGDTWVLDEKFLEVIKILENDHFYYPQNRYSIYLKDYIKDGICEKGRIDLMWMRLFNDNGDLMTFILNGCKARYLGYDENIRNVFKQKFEDKVNKYFTRLNSLEKSVSSKKKTVKKEGNSQNQGEDR